MQFILNLGVLRSLLLLIVVASCVLGNYALISVGTAYEIRLLNIVGSSIGVILIFTLLLDITMLLVIQRHMPTNSNWRFRTLIQLASLASVLGSWAPYITVVLSK